MTSAHARPFPWWLSPLLVVVVLGGFGLYSLWVTLAGFQDSSGQDLFRFGPYHSPFYSPFIEADWWPLSPAILILWAPLGFRATCYYYRKAYYRAFFWDPPACTIAERRGARYSGETRFPFILQNLHRFFLYLAIIVWLILAYETIRAFIFNGQFGIGVGSLIFLINIISLGFYTFSCHSFRHLIGGRLDCFSCSAAARVRHKAWEGISAINKNHMLWAWLSLFSVALTDLYVRLLVWGVLRDFRFF